jgi:hypothetical protein
MRHTAAFRTTAAPTATNPGGSLYAIANVPLRVVEIGVFNTTVTACGLQIVRLTTAGTQGAGITEAPFDTDRTPQGTAFNSHTSTGPTLGGVIRAFSIGAAIGAGAIFTFDSEPVRIPQGTGNGIGVISVGTGQILDLYFDWDE